jgi:hypothetical protein
MTMQRKSMVALVMILGAAGIAGAQTKAVEETPTDPGTIDLPRPGGLDSGGEDWGRYEMTAAQPVDGLARIGAHHATRWDSNPAAPKVEFEMSEYEVEWDIAETGLEIKADHVPGYKIGVRVCARSNGNIGGDDGAVDTLEFTGASTSPETQLATFDPTGAGTCKTVYLTYPVEAGADEYTIMVRPQLQIVQPYWQWTVYGNVTVQYYPILASR